MKTKIVLFLIPLVLFAIPNTASILVLTQVDASAVVNVVMLMGVLFFFFGVACFYAYQGKAGAPIVKPLSLGFAIAGFATFALQLWLKIR